MKHDVSLTLFVNTVFHVVSTVTTASSAVPVVFGTASDVTHVGNFVKFLIRLSCSSYISQSCIVDKFPSLKIIFVFLVLWVLFYSFSLTKPQKPSETLLKTVMRRFAVTLHLQDETRSNALHFGSCQKDAAVALQ